VSSDRGKSSRFVATFRRATTRRTTHGAIVALQAQSGGRPAGRIRSSAGIRTRSARERGSSSVRPCLRSRPARSREFSRSAWDCSASR
jgi:hypothetical protein